MDKPTLGRLNHISLREVWRSEASDFTPWLAKQENLALLGDTIGFNLELEAQEKTVGDFRADILCRDVENGGLVLVENQLERSDHSHLGQLLTYAAGLSAQTIVWIADKFTEEHRAAIDWLNENTGQEVNFFALEIELWRIGDSPAAPKFNVVSKPNIWTRCLHDTRRNTQIQQFCLEYWNGVFDLAREDGILRPSAVPYGRKDTVFDVGWRHFQLKAYFSTAGKKMAVWVRCIGDDGFKNFQHLNSHRAEIEGRYGHPLEWLPYEKENRGTIIHKIDGYDANDRETWPVQHRLLADSLVKFYRATNDFIICLDQASASDPWANEVAVAD